MSRKHYPKEYRDQLVSLARSGRSLSSLASEFEPSLPPLRNWVERAEGSSASQDLEMARELRRWKRKCVLLQEERDILAKATAWFAKATKTRSRSTSS